MAAVSARRDLPHAAAPGSFGIQRFAKEMMGMLAAHRHHTLPPASDLPIGVGDHVAMQKSSSKATNTITPNFADDNVTCVASTRYQR